MPAHGSTPDEVVNLYTQAGGTWWLAIATNRPVAGDTTATLADIPPLEVARSSAQWADSVAGTAMHATGVTMPAATADTSAAAWCLFNDEACTDLALSRWFATTRDIVEGFELPLTPTTLAIEFVPESTP